MTRTNYHVTKRDRLWWVSVGGQVIDCYRTQRECLRQLRVHCRTMWLQYKAPSEIHIRDLDGQVRAKDTYGNDPPETKG